MIDRYPKLSSDQGGSSWDNGAEGNYWGAEGLEDYDGNGIEDAPHIIDEDSRDNFPLKEPWSPLKVFYINVTSVAKIFEVSVASSSTTGNLTFSQPDKQISFRTSCYSIPNRRFTSGARGIRKGENCVPLLERTVFLCAWRILNASRNQPQGSSFTAGRHQDHIPV